MFEAKCRMFDFMLTSIRVALAREKKLGQATYRDLLRTALKNHRGENLTVGTHPLSEEDSRIANNEFREHLLEMHTQLTATLDEFDD
jgi:hypothetical protein